VNELDKHQNKKLSKSSSPIVIICATVGLFFAAQFLASLVFVFITIITGWGDAEFKAWFDASAFPQFLYVAVSDILIISGVWLLLKKKQQSFKTIGLSKPLFSDAVKALLAYGCYIVMFAIITVISKMVAPSLNLEQEQQIGFEANKGIVNLLLAGVSLVILPPIVEEILCRGYLYTGLKSRMKFIPATIITSLVFATAHLQFGSDAPLLWVAAIDTFVLSLVLVYLREKTGRLAAPMFLHAYKNLVAFSILFIFAK
jgi:membrane protease YdiL (CAAX protease family)